MKMTRKFGMPLAMVAGLALVGAACGSSGSTASHAAGGTSPTSASGPPIVVGLSIALSGAEAIPQLQEGYRQAVDEVNAAGGLTVGGVRRPIKLVVLDNRSDSSLLASQVHTLVLQDNAVALVSGCCDLNVTEIPLANALKVPLVGTAIPTDLVAGINGQYGWNVYVNLASVANYFTKVVPALGQTNGKVALIANNNPQGLGAQAIFTQFAKAANFQVTAQALVPAGTTDYSAFINRAKQSNADNLVAQMDGPDCFALWKQMKALNYQPKTAEANQCGANPSWRGLGGLGDGALLGMDWTPQSGLPDAAKMASTFSRAYPNDVIDQQVAVNSYTVMQVLSSAITRADSTDPAKINAAIGQTSGPFPLGIVSFDAHHDWAASTFTAQWQNGNVIQVYPPAAGASPRFPLPGLAG